MYTQFFNLHQAPFSIAPDPHYLFMSEQHREALAHLLYGVGGGGGFVLLTGEIGAGKTTICRCFLEQIPSGCNVAYIFNPKLTVPELLQSICDEFGIGIGLRHSTGADAASVKDYVDALNAYLLAAHTEGRHNVLIIDEAQSLSAGVLEQLRLLTNLETSQSKLLQIVLIGQPELRSMLARPELEQLAQRVIARYHLGPLTAPETARYIRHRLAVAGMLDATVFPPPVMQQIHRLTHGVPRRINLLCDRALLGAYTENKHTVDHAIVRQAAREVFGDFAVATDAALAPAIRPALVWLMAGTIILVALALGWNLRQEHSTQGQQDKTTLAKTSQTPPAAAASLQVEAGWPDRKDAYRQLAQLWGFTLRQGPPCQAVLQQRVACHVASGIGLAALAQLDRPAILTLQDQDNTSSVYYALLTGLTPDSATLRTGNGSKTVPLAALEAQFHGQLVTFWRTPTVRDIAGMAFGPGTQGAEVDWIAARLAQSEQSPPPAGQVFNQALTLQVQQFQRTHGLVADGIVGPMTFMYLNRAAGIEEPRLHQAGVATAESGK
ncbi:MAG: AAA family ATPase [Glaciimonas sp.]|nr:AAA family ATPase [Glaciimonas sp.]